MADHLTPERRSWNMSRVRSCNTKPERAVRSLLHRLGYRFRLHGKVAKRLHPDGCLPGKPDVVLAGHRTAVFVHGCFWHRHCGCAFATTPKTRTDYWQAKFRKNVERDRRVQAELRALGWKVIVVWECEVRDLDALAERLEQAIRGDADAYPDTPADVPLAAEEQHHYDA